MAGQRGLLRCGRPMGASVESPNSLPLIYMTYLDLVRRTGSVPVIEIDHQPVSIGRIPLEQCLWKTRLIKVAKDLVIVRINPNLDEVEKEEEEEKKKASCTILRNDKPPNTDGTRGNHLLG